MVGNGQQELASRAVAEYDATVRELRLFAPSGLVERLNFAVWELVAIAGVSDAPNPAA